jgi:transmembrane sensor
MAMEYKIDELIIKYLSGTLTEEEQVELDEWKALPENRRLLDQLSNGDWVKKELQKIAGVKEVNAYNKLSQIYAQQNVPVKMHKTGSKIIWWLAAASLILIAGAGSWFLLSRPSEKAAPVELAKPEDRFKNDVQPGGNRAKLLLADGTEIVLDNAGNGLLSQQGGAKVIKLDNGSIEYKQEAGTGDKEAIVYNTVSTPKGGQYMISLPDGSKAWLNASSTLRFPTAFTGDKRIVELTGEGYFEVRPSLPPLPLAPPEGGEIRRPEKRGIKKPFIVKAGDVHVEVLGTHFNVNAYTDEEVIKTTLLEGAVKVIKGNASGVLKPGEQAQASRQGTLKTVKQADLEQTMAWHNGVFAFRNASVVAIMRQAQRWYDIEVIYAGKVNKDQALNGDIPMNVALSQLLKILEATGSVHFRIEGKTVTVMP